MENKIHSRWKKRVNKYGTIDKKIPDGAALVWGDYKVLKKKADQLGLFAALHRIGWKKENITGKYYPIYDGIVVDVEDVSFLQEEKDPSPLPDSSIQEFTTPFPFPKTTEDKLEEKKRKKSKSSKNLMQILQNHPEIEFVSKYEQDLAKQAWEYSLNKHGLAWRWSLGIETQFNLNQTITKILDEYLLSLESNYQLQF